MVPNPPNDSGDWLALASPTWAPSKPKKLHTFTQFAWHRFAHLDPKQPYRVSLKL